MANKNAAHDTRQQRPEEAGTIVYFVRHTDVHNPDDILYGRLPRFGLSALGRQQADVTASVLAEEPVDVFFTSPQLRARQTLKVIAAAHPDAPIHTSSLLAEVVTGWQGRPHSDLEGIGFNFYDNPLHPADEGLDDLWVRIRKFVGRVRRGYPGNNVVALTHGDIVHLARAGFRGLPIEIASIRLPHPYPGKGSLTRFTFSGDLDATYPLSVEYYDPNGDDPAWSGGWVNMEILPADD
ncbi:MAG: histidine phosphatase family protein [Chloroflexota bacterium]